MLTHEYKCIERITCFLEGAITQHLVQPSLAMILMLSFPLCIIMFSLTHSSKMTIKPKEGEAMTYGKYEDLEENYVAGKVLKNYLHETYNVLLKKGGGESPPRPIYVSVCG